MDLGAAWSRHWPEYLIEGACLGLFMISAGFFTALLWAPASPLAGAFSSELERRLWMGLAMGLTAIALIYSPWGQQSGAHMNPAVTLAFLRLGKIAAVDALFYMVFQLLGGISGVLLVRLLLGAHFTEAPVSWVLTLPGESGPWIAFFAELLISGLMMVTVLGVSGTPQIERYTGLCAGLLVALFITFEAPFSGMSINPARTLASALPAKHYAFLWIYLTAPVLGMLLAVDADRLLRDGAAIHCAKLVHPADQRCIHCGQGLDENSR